MFELMDGKFSIEKNSCGGWKLSEKTTIKKKNGSEGTGAKESWHINIEQCLREILQREMGNADSVHALLGIIESATDKINNAVKSWQGKRG